MHIPRTEGAVLEEPAGGESLPLGSPWRGSLVLAEPRPRKASVCHREGEDDFLEGGAVTFVLVDDVKQKQKQKQLYCALLEMSALSLSHNSLLLDGKKKHTASWFPFSQRKPNHGRASDPQTKYISSVFG